MYSLFSMKHIFAIAAMAAAVLESAAFEIYSDFPGGNIDIVEKGDSGAKIRQQYRDSDWWFYWSFGVKGAEGRTLTFGFVDSGDVIGSRGPAASFDGGKTWKWLGAQGVKRKKHSSSFEFAFPDGAKDVRFAFCLPYMPTDFDAFAKSAPSLKKMPLCKTRKGRENFAYSLGNPDGKIKIFLTSRHHACETTGTFAMQGILEEFLKKGGAAEKLLKDAEIVAVPFMDLDGVLDGDQGKGRKPHDHNRDYTKSPIYPSVAAFQKLYNAKMEKAETVIALDLHSPFMFKGGEDNTDNRAYFVEGPIGSKVENLRKLSKILEAETLKSGEGAIIHLQKWDVKYGTLWNTPSNMKDVTCSAWAGRHPKAAFACSVEIPYTDCVGAEVNSESLRGFGANIAKSLAEYFAAPESKESKK